MKIEVWARICITISILSFWGASASAQQKHFIRAGEQQKHTRLVFPSASDQNWEMRTSNRRVTLSISDASVDYDDEKIFDRIARGRILETSSERIGRDVFVRLSLGCDCIATAKVEGIDLIIDVSQKEPEPDKRRPAQSPKAEEPNAETKATVERRPTSRPQKNAADVEENYEKTEQATQPEIPADVFDVSERLKKQLEKAADQGLIELAQNEDVEVQRVIESIPETASEEIVSLPALDATIENIDGLDELAKRANRSFSASHGEDGELSDSFRITVPEGFQLNEPDKRSGSPNTKDSESPEQQSEMFCFEDEYLDVRNWSDGRSFSAQFSELQSQAFGEFDEPVTSAVHELIRLYLYFGLGTEANSLVEDLAENDTQSKLFTELARLVEGEPYVPDGSLDALAGCEGLNSLWRTAAIDNSEKQPVSNSRGLIQEFSDFPIEIRRLIGPRIVQSFITRNQLEEAVRVFSIVDRAPGAHGDEHHFVGAKLDILNGNAEEGEHKLWSLINSGSHKSVESSIALSNSILSRGAEVPSELIELLDTLAFEYRETSIGLDLRLAEIFSRSGSNRIADAVEVIQREMSSRPEFQQEYYQALDGILANASAEKSGHGALLQTFFDNRALFLSNGISLKTKQHLASEFLQSGLPQASLEILSTASAATDETSRLAMAQARLELDDPSEALDLISDISTADAQSAMIKALSKLGRHSESYETAAIQNSDRVPLYAWNAGVWEDAANSSEKNIKTLAQYMLLSSENAASIDPRIFQADSSNPESAILAQLPEEEKISLEYAQELSKQSQLVRQFFENALSDFQ